MSRTMEGYAAAARATAIYPGRGSVRGLTYTALGLAGEAGEAADHVKKAVRDDMGIVTEDRRAHLIGELGDVLWYVATMADELGVTLDDVAEANIVKLASRKRRGKIGGSGDDR